MQPAIVVDHVWKKFVIGQARYTSLRDGLAGIARWLFRLKAPSESARTREFYALKDVSLDVGKGTTLGIIGPNGAGKSTLLKLISRVSRPTRGTITTHGRLSALIEVGAGFHPELTGRENVYMNASILGMSRDEVDAKFDRIVAFAGLENFIDTPVKHYSSGMYARLGFSVAAHVDPEILLVDEVLSVGDWSFQKKCFDHMQKIRDGGATIVFVSHNMTAIGNLCEKCVLLSEGHVVRYGETSEVICEYHDIGGSQRRAAAKVLETGDDRLHIDVLAFNLIGPEGGVTAVFESGDAFAADIQMRFNHACEDPVLILTLRNERGMLVFRTDSRVMDAHIGAMRSGEVARVTLRGRMNLAPGNYRLWMGVDAMYGETAMTTDRDTVTFTIPDNPRVVGIADLGLDIQAERLADATDGQE